MFNRFKNIFFLRLFPVILCMLMPLLVSGQTVRVKKIKWEVSMIADDSIFRVGRPNPLAINVKGTADYAIHVEGGTIAKKQDKYAVYAKEEGAVTVSVYEKLPGKKMRVLYTKLFVVKKIPPPQLFVCGVRADSMIDRQQIIHDNVLTAYHPFYKVNLPVVGFDVVFGKAGKDKLSSQNNHFTIDMRKRIYSLQPGTLLTFENIYYLMPDGTKEKIESLEVFVVETNKYKVGYRVMGL